MADVSGGRQTRLEIVVPAVHLEFDKKLLRKVLSQAGQEIKRTAAALIGRDASGRTYGRHTASGPGKPPANLTGALKHSLKVRARGDRVSILEAKNYGKMLETGALGGGGKGSATVGRVHRRGKVTGKVRTRRVMAARPFLSTAAEGELPRLGKRIQAALARSIDLKVLRKAGG